MGSYFPSHYQPANGFRTDEWLQPAYFDRPCTDEDFVSSPAETVLDGRAYIEPSLLDWSTPSADFALPSGYCFDRNLPLSTGRSDTPDLCEDGEYFPGNDSLPHTPVDERAPSNSTESGSSEPKLEQPVKRKRGRPRIIRADSDSTSSKHGSRASKRLPHNQVERKYREGLNAELERLRLAIPTLPQWDVQAMNGPPKPSKATVLASAIDYIHKMELEREQLRQENDALRATKRLPGSGQANASFRGYAWS